MSDTESMKKYKEGERECVCVCERERECVCVCEREREIMRPENESINKLMKLMKIEKFRQETEKRGLGGMISKKRIEKIPSPYLTYNLMKLKRNRYLLIFLYTLTSFFVYFSGANGRLYSYIILICFFFTDFSTTTY